MNPLLKLALGGTGSFLRGIWSAYAEETSPNQADIWWSDEGVGNGSGNWTVSVTANVVTIDTITPHNLLAGLVFSANDGWTTSTWMNWVEATISTVPNNHTFTFPLTQTDQGAATEAGTAAHIGQQPSYFQHYEVWREVNGGGFFLQGTTTDHFFTQAGLTTSWTYSWQIYPRSIAKLGVFTNTNSIIIAG